MTAPIIDPALTENGAQRLVIAYSWALLAGDTEAMIRLRRAASRHDGARAAIDAVDAQLRASLAVTMTQEVK